MRSGRVGVGVWVLAAALLLAGCRGGAPGADAAAGAPPPAQALAQGPAAAPEGAGTVSVGDGLFVDGPAGAAAEAAGLSDAPIPPAAGVATAAGDAPRASTLMGQALLDEGRAACTRQRGRFGPGGKGGILTCYTTPRDAGRQCDSADDCDGLCLARSRTCAPVTPMFGCNEILTGSGARVTQCVD